MINIKTYSFFEKIKKYFTLYLSPTLRSGEVLFYGGLLLKIILSCFFASKVLTHLFIPFVDYFVTSGFQNPYQRFLGVGDIAHFPYPALMLYLLALPKFLLGWLFPDSGAWQLFLIRLPLLIADFAIFFILRGWFQNKFPIRLLIFYWLSPVLIYISYIHGQLDAIPIALLFGSLFYLFRNQTLYAAIFLGLALATKTNMLLVYPFFLLFLISRGQTLFQLIIFFALAAFAFIIVNFLYLFDDAFLHMVFLNQTQFRLFDAFLPLNNLVIYLIPASLLVLFVRGALLRHYNRDIFIMFLGFTFSIILLFITPTQGWYFWLIPFLVYFYIKKSGRASLVFFCLSFFYLLYFMITADTQFDLLQPIGNGADNFFYYHLQKFNIDTEIVVNLVFTALQTTLLVNCFMIYRTGLESYSQYKITVSPFLIGIGGNSGTGKSTISNALLRILTPQNTVIIRGDDMHKWQRGHEKWQDFTHLDPKANHLHSEIDSLKKLKAGRKVYRRHYDHDTGQFTQEKLLKAKNIIIFEGLHSFYLSMQNHLYDLKIFMKPSLELMQHWKIIRDKNERGHSKEKTLQQLRSREKDSKKYIETQIKNADIVIEIFPTGKIKNIGDDKQNITIYYQIKLSNLIYIEPLLEALESISSLTLTHEYEEDGFQTIILKGTASTEQVQMIAQEQIVALEDIGVDNPIWQEGLLGTVLLILVYSIFQKAENENG